MRFTVILAVTNNLIVMRRARRMESILPNNLPFDVLVEWESRRYYPFDLGGHSQRRPVEWKVEWESRMGILTSASNGKSYIVVKEQLLYSCIIVCFTKPLHCV